MAEQMQPSGKGRGRARRVLGAVLTSVGIALALALAGALWGVRITDSGTTSASSAAVPGASAPMAAPTAPPPAGAILGVLDMANNRLLLMLGSTYNLATNGYSSLPYWNADPGGPFSGTNLPGWARYEESIKTVVIRDSIAPNYTAYWFAYLHHLTAIENMGMLNTAQVKSMEGMFFDCLSLRESSATNPNGLNVATANFNVGQCVNVRGMFSGCVNVSRIDLSGWNAGASTTAQITDWGSLFAQCLVLSTINGVADLDTSGGTNMSYMFADCRALPGLDLRRWDTKNVTNLECMFYRSAIGTLQLGADSQNLDTGAGVLEGTFVPLGCTVS